MTSTRTPFTSSSSVNTRPISGFTPSTLQRFAVVLRAGTCSGSESPESVAAPGWVAAMSVKIVLRRRHSNHSAGAGKCFGMPAWLTDPEDQICGVPIVVWTERVDEVDDQDL